MHVLIIPDKFKGSLTASEVSEAMTIGLRRAHPDIEARTVIASDGGDGFLESVQQNISKVARHECLTRDPLGREIHAHYLFDAQSATAFVEMAQASGLVLLKSEERDPNQASTFGTGLLIRDAIDRGARRVYVGLGGSATNDGGIGIAAALGWRFLDANGCELQSVGGRLGEIESIDASKVMPTLRDVELLAINDVGNPLFGTEGAAHIYGPQKGADAQTVERLDAGLQNLDRVVRRDLDIHAANLAGSGAAGGTGFGLHVFADASFVSGIEFILELAGVEGILSHGGFDWIVTGEGKIDDQTAYGKLVRGVSRIGARHGVPVVAICGALDLREQTVQDLGLANVTAIHDPAQPLSYTMENASRLVEQAATAILRSDQA